MLRVLRGVLGVSVEGLREAEAVNPASSGRAPRSSRLRAGCLNGMKRQQPPEKDRNKNDRRERGGGGGTQRGAATQTDVARAQRGGAGERARRCPAGGRVGREAGGRLQSARNREAQVKRSEELGRQIHEWASRMQIAHSREQIRAARALGRGTGWLGGRRGPSAPESRPSPFKCTLVYPLRELRARTNTLPAHARLSTGGVSTSVCVCVRALRLLIARSLLLSQAY
ncbi:uncharacterized protein LOC123327960 isoform X2 [Bubalus bubalis]|uniref:uncharacterized protein LOC123327960 isoform X2 n=1 Tax=Bubalus bubalis TaxID=89462 RepID=UPI001D0FC496|nr:uncharacterized protein LOC123327960 isoform X2 [Bubalus bubalis]